MPGLNGLTTGGDGVAAPLAWWERGWILAGLALLVAAPAMWPDVAPLVDLPGHMGRYRIQLDLAASPELQRFFGFSWMPIGNLGVDLLVAVLAPLLGLEGAVKIIVVAIPALTAGGFLWIAREAHGRVPPTALFALPLAWNFPFLFGFVNFALSMALALLAFALWLRLVRTERNRLRVLLFLPLSMLIWTAHAFGWATLCLLAGSLALARAVDRGPSPKLLFGETIRCWPLLPPLALTIAWRAGDVAGDTGDWFNVPAKLSWFLMTFRDRWAVFDLGCLAILCVLAYAAWRQPGFRLNRALAIAAGLLAVAFALLPRILLGSAYADMRIAPYLLAVAILAVGTVCEMPSARKHRIALLGLMFVLVRLIGTTISTAQYDADYRRELAALDHVPNGARVAAFVGRACGDPWAMSRLDHLPSLAIVRRSAFANDQWAMAGAQLVRVDYPAAGRFATDPSQIVVANGCRGTPWSSIDRALAELPRGAFDYVWLIRPPRYEASLTAGMTPVWREGSSALFRIDRR